MFASNGTQGNISQRSQDIFLRLRTALNDAADFQAWLAAQSSADLTAAGFTDQDLTFLRSAFADVTALRDITFGGLPPASYPQPSGTYDYSANVRQIIGPL